MFFVRELTRQQLPVTKEKGWPLRGTMIVFAVIAYVVLELLKA